MYPVATWKLHDITKHPICWLFAEAFEGDVIAFVFDGKEYKRYEGNLEDGQLSPVTSVELFGRRWDEREDMKEPALFDQDDSCGVEIAVMKDGVHDITVRIGARDIGRTEWGLILRGEGRSEDDLVFGCFYDISAFRIDITPECVTVQVRQ